MIRFINRFIKPRSFFIWHFFIASSMLLSALFFQYIIGLAPCELCVYQRFIFNCIIVISLIGLIPRSRWLQFFLISLIVAGYLISLWLAIHQVNIEQGLIISACKLSAIFPSWLPLDQWLPWLYLPTTGCADVSWALFGYSMAEILIAAALFFSIWASVSLIYSLKKPPKMRIAMN